MQVCGKHCKRDLCMDATESASCSMSYPELCGLQWRAVALFVSGKDVLVCIPTGGGKLLCYLILLQVFNLHEKESSMVIVVSPLVAFNLDTFCKFLEQAITLEPSALWQYCSWVCWLSHVTQNVFVCWATQNLAWFWLSWVGTYHSDTVLTEFWC